MTLKPAGLTLPSPPENRPMTAFHMTYEEREHLKVFADQDESLAEVIFMIAHWMRQPEAVPFSNYAANWAAAHTSSDVAAMRQHWPLTGPRMIANGQSGWGSYGR